MRAISPYHYDTDFPNGLSFDQMLDIFAARIQGWQIDPAEHLLKVDIHAGFAVLSILMSYFETIAQFERGRTSDKESPDFFIHGFGMVFPHYQHEMPENVYKTKVKRLYHAVRSGLYHDSMTRSDVLIHGQLPDAISLFADSNEILINPHKLPIEIKNHLHRYLRYLRSSENEQHAKILKQLLEQ